MMRLNSERGGDGPDRTGPPRVTASGLLSVGNVKRGAYACFTIAADVGTLSRLCRWLADPPARCSINSCRVGPTRAVHCPSPIRRWASFLSWPSSAWALCAVRIGSALHILVRPRSRPASRWAFPGRSGSADQQSPRCGSRSANWAKYSRDRGRASRTVWVYTGLMLLPFALLAPIAHALPRGHVWPALMALPVALALIYRFIHEPRGRGFNRILVLDCADAIAVRPAAQSRIGIVRTIEHPAPT